MAKFTEWCPALEAALAEPFPPEFVQQKTKGRTAIDFVAWHHYARRLSELVGGGWSVGELTMRDVGGKLLLALPLTILGTTRTNVGTEDEGKDDYGDAATNAWAQAFKRSAALFGVGLGMYDKAGVAEKYKGKTDHDAALAFIREIAARCEPNVTMMFKGESFPVQAATKEAWATLKRDRDAALTFARAVSQATGQPFTA